jgi:hypothetical protein
MDSYDDDRRIGGLVLFLLGGLAGTFLALRWSRRSAVGTEGAIDRLQKVLDESVDSVESAVAYVRTMAEPVHELLDEATALAGGIKKTLDSYRQIGDKAAVEGYRYVPSMAPPAVPS